MLVKLMEFFRITTELNTTVKMRSGSTKCSKCYLKTIQLDKGICLNERKQYLALVAGACSERKKMFHGGSFLKLADDDV